MNRLLRGLVAPVSAALALAPLAVSAASPTPTPSPALDGILSAPPAGFVALTTASLHGHFTAEEYASDADTTKQARIVATMNHDGFIDGYGQTWVSQSTQQVLIEAVLAFTGGRGARDWLTAAEAADKQDANYVRPDTTEGLGTYYGAHLEDKAGKTFADEFSFVKGNDVFAVAVAATKDDTLGQATTQAQSQFKSAPDSTVPSAQWPENSEANNTAFQVGATIGRIAIFALIGAIVAAIAFFIRSRRRGVATPAYAGAYGAPAAAGGVQLSPDGNYWWDGQAWRDAATEVPPAAQRSSDGGFWWDGRTWRPVPQASPPPAG